MPGDAERSVQGVVADGAQFHLARAGGVQRRRQGQELAGHVVVVAGYFHLHRVRGPDLAVGTAVDGDDVAVVGDPQPQGSTGSTGGQRAGAFPP